MDGGAGEGGRAVIDRTRYLVEQETVEIERNTRIMALAEHNGWRPEIVNQPWSHWTKWWRVPPEFVPIAGCMMAAVK